MQSIDAGRKDGVLTLFRNTCATVSKREGWLECDHLNERRLRLHPLQRAARWEQFLEKLTAGPKKRPRLPLVPLINRLQFRG